MNSEIETFNNTARMAFQLNSPKIANLKFELEKKLEQASGQKISLKNDHIAFRSYGVEPFNLNYFHDLLLKYGYEKQADYDFKKKKLRAASYINLKNEEIPRVFVSEPKVEEFSELIQQTLKKSMKLKSDLVTGDIYDIFLTGSPLLHTVEDVKIKEYEQIKKESEYVSWVLVNGIVPNHFTISVNDTGFSLTEILFYVQDLGYKLHGESLIQKSEDLWQSSIVADQVEKEIAQDGYFHKYSFPTCFYEFAERFNGFDGFVENNADKIFESTYARK